VKTDSAFESVKLYQQVLIVFEIKVHPFVSVKKWNIGVFLKIAQF
jgi:hypothetical protein